MMLQNVNQVPFDILHNIAPDYLTGDCNNNKDNKTCYHGACWQRVLHCIIALLQFVPSVT